MTQRATKSGFGALLDKLIEERRLSNRELAKLAKVAPDTLRIQRMESRCRFRELTSDRVLKELSAIKPLSKDELAQYVKLTGITLEGEGHRAKLARLAGNSTGRDAEELFTKLVEEFGPARVAEALRSISGVMRGGTGGPR